MTETKEVIITLRVPISRPFWGKQTEDEFSNLFSDKNLSPDKRTQEIKKIHELYAVKNPIWNVKTWRKCLLSVQNRCALHYNARVADLVREIESGAFEHNNVQQSYGYKPPIGQKENFLPPSIKQGIGDKLASNTKDIRKFKKKPPYTKGNWIKINRPKETTFKIEKINNKYVISGIELPTFNDKSMVISYIGNYNAEQNSRSFILDLKARIKDGWDIPGSYNNNLKCLVENENNLLEGESKLYSNCCEIIEKDGKYCIHFVVKVNVEQKQRDENIICGVDIGIRNPIVVSCGNQFFRMGGNEFWHMKKAQYRIRKEKSRDNGLRRTGHGIDNKFKYLTAKTEKQQLREKAWINRVVKQAFNWILHTKAGTVQLEGLSNMSVGKQIPFPYKKIQERLQSLLETVGIKVEYVNPQYTSRRCYKCGYINEYFDYAYRTNKKNYDGNKPPKFVCRNDKCKLGEKEYIDGDRVGATNLSVKNIAKLILTQCKKQGIVVKSNDDTDTVITEVAITD